MLSFDFRSTVASAVIALGLLAALSARAAAPAPILVVGDSLSAAHGIALDEGWVALLERRLSAQGYGQHVVNASVSGETSGGAAALLAGLLERHHPGIVVLEIGGNDGLRGLPLEVLRTNLAGMIAASQAAGAQVVLLGMRIPPNYGPRYTEEFRSIYTELAEHYATAFVPFMLEGIALDPTLMQDDGIHPRAAAEPLILDQVWASLEPLLKDARAGALPASPAGAGPARH